MQVKNMLLEKKILESARRCFFEYGYKKTQIKMIAKGACATPGNIYTYFESKEDIFDKVIGDVPFQMASYIEEYYKPRLLELVEKKQEINTNIFLEEDIHFSDEVSMTLSILFNGSKGTKYEKYSEGLFNIIQNCTYLCLGNNVNQATVNTLVYSFIEQIIAVCQRKKVDGQDTRITKSTEAYCFSIDVAEKILRIVIIQWIFLEGEELEIALKLFFEEYNKWIDEIATYEYKLVIDCKQIPDIAENSTLQRLIANYCKSGFLKIECIFLKKQIAWAMTLKRIFLVNGYSNIEIVMEE